MKKKLDLSVVVMARNDNYGGNWINRINAFLKTWDYFANKHKRSIEIILVEYNPIEGKKYLHEELNMRSNDYLIFKTIIVPNEFHNSLPNSNQVQICEFIAKNIGIKRAGADYILAMNPDIVISENLFKHITKKENLGTKSFYRVNRYDTTCNYIDPNFSAEEIQKHINKNVIRILYNHQTKYVSWKDWIYTFIHGRTLKTFFSAPVFNIFKKFDYGNSVINENAAGDFLLAHKDIWQKVGGYDQTTTGSGIYDGYIMYMLYCMGYKQIIIKDPIYHLYHDHNGVKYLASYKKFRQDVKEMLKTKIPYRKPIKNWGFPNKEFEQVIK